VEAEGGCGVTGFAAGVPVSGRHIFAPSMVGLDPEALGVTPEILEEDYLLQIAYLDPEVRLAVEERFITYGHKGQRFLGCGLGLNTDAVHFEVYGSSGDYLASGIDGMAIYVHGHAQDQLGQIMKRGRLVVYGNVSMTFMYGAKGSEFYVLGNAAGRPLINAVGRPGW